MLADDDRRDSDLPLTAALLALALLAGCGGDAAAMTTIRDAQKSASQPLYWAGDEVDGQELTGDDAQRRRGDAFSTATARTKSAREAVPCRSRSRRPRSATSRRSSSTCARPGAGPSAASPLASAAPAPIDLATGTSNITVRADSPRRLERTLAALKPVEGASRGELPPPRYPLEYITELRRTRDAFVRTGSVRAARNELRISQRAIRFRLRLAERLGSARLRRPADQFRGEPCPVEPAR